MRTTAVGDRFVSVCCSMVSHLCCTTQGRVMLRNVGWLSRLCRWHGLRQQACYTAHRVAFVCHASKYNKCQSYYRRERKASNLDHLDNTTNTIKCALPQLPCGRPHWAQRLVPDSKRCTSYAATICNAAAVRRSCDQGRRPTPPQRAARSLLCARKHSRARLPR